MLCDICKADLPSELVSLNDYGKTACVSCLYGVEISCHTCARFVHSQHIEDGFCRAKLAIVAADGRCKTYLPVAGIIQRPQ